MYDISCTSTTPSTVCTRPSNVLRQAMDQLRQTMHQQEQHIKNLSETIVLLVNERQQEERDVNLYAIDNDNSTSTTNTTTPTTTPKTRFLAGIGCLVVVLAVVAAIAAAWYFRFRSKNEEIEELEMASYTICRPVQNVNYLFVDDTVYERKPVETCSSSGPPWAPTYNSVGHETNLVHVNMTAPVQPEPERHVWMPSSLPKSRSDNHFLPPVPNEHYKWFADTMNTANDCTCGKTHSNSDSSSFY